MVSNRPKDGQVYDGKQADVWSCGVILYIMLCARFPFERSEDSSLPYADKLKRVLQRIVKVEYTFPSSTFPNLCQYTSVMNAIALDVWYLPRFQFIMHGMPCTQAYLIGSIRISAGQVGWK